MHSSLKLPGRPMEREVLCLNAWVMCRWVGHTTMWSTTFHGILYYIYWGIDKDIKYVC